MSDSPSQPLLVTEVDLVSALILTRNGKLTGVEPATSARNLLWQFRVDEVTPQGRDLANSWQAHRFAGTDLGLKVGPFIPVVIACRLAVSSRTLLHWAKTGFILNAGNLLAPEMVAAIAALKSPSTLPPS